MGLLAYVRAALISNELPDLREGQLSVDRQGALWVVQSSTASPPTPAAPVALATSNALPAAGAYEAAPTTSSTAGVAIPAGTQANPTRGATITFLYTQGASSGQMAVKVYGYDGSKWGQMPSSVDQSYSGISLGTGTGQYALAVDLKYGITRIAVCGAETGVTGTPGTYSAEVVFG